MKKYQLIIKDNKTGEILIDDDYDSVNYDMKNDFHYVRITDNYDPVGTVGTIYINLKAIKHYEEWDEDKK